MEEIHDDEFLRDHKYKYVFVAYDTDSRSIDALESGLREAREWCREHFGAPGSRWRVLWDEFHFSDQKDAIFFKLRWWDR